MYVEVVDVDRCGGVFETDADFDGGALGAGVEGEQRMLVKAELAQHSLQSWVPIGHVLIVCVRSGKGIAELWIGEIHFEGYARGWTRNADKNCGTDLRVVAGGN